MSISMSNDPLALFARYRYELSPLPGANVFVDFAFRFSYGSHRHASACYLVLGIFGTGQSDSAPLAHERRCLEPNNTRHSCVSGLSAREYSLSYSATGEKGGPDE